ncbi:hypothetical protein OG216_25830 [Streptomycetaceae bacterium NBC_01309]
MSRGRANPPNAASKPWNEGLTGPRPDKPPVPLTEACPTDGCGIPEDVLDEGDPTVWGWILVRVNGSALEGRWFCSASCASAGTARAQLRMRPDGGAEC